MKSSLFAVAAACLSMLLAASARADYVPHVELVPYQIVNSQNQCVQLNQGIALSLAACDSANNLQKFYVLNESSDTGVVFQTQTDGGGAVVRIAPASSFDAVPAPIGAYNLVNSNGGLGVGVALATPVAPWQFRWRMTRSNPFPFVGKAWAANENATFRITGLRTIYYGANDRWIQKTVDATSTYATNDQIPCTNAYFGGDPIYGVVKACYIADSLLPVTKFQVRLESYAYPNICMSYTPVWQEVIGAPCNGQNQDPFMLTFTFKPTSYPG